MELEEHQNSHTGEKPFECDVCKARFNRRSTLWNHKRIHSDTKPFSCPVCNMTFKWKNSLKCHREMHVRKNETGAMSLDNYGSITYAGSNRKSSSKGGSKKSKKAKLEASAAAAAGSPLSVGMDSNSFQLAPDTTIPTTTSTSAASTPTPTSHLMMDITGGGGGLPIGTTLKYEHQPSHHHHPHQHLIGGLMQHHAQYAHQPMNPNSMMSGPFSQVGNLLNPTTATITNQLSINPPPSSANFLPSTTTLHNINNNNTSTTTATNIGFVKTETNPGDIVGGQQLHAPGGVGGLTSSDMIGMSHSSILQSTLHHQGVNDSGKHSNSSASSYSPPSDPAPSGTVIPISTTAPGGGQQIAGITADSANNNNNNNNNNININIKQESQESSGTSTINDNISATTTTTTTNPSTYHFNQFNMTANNNNNNNNNNPIHHQLQQQATPSPHHQLQQQQQQQQQALPQLMLTNPNNPSSNPFPTTGDSLLSTYPGSGGGLHLLNHHRNLSSTNTNTTMAQQSSLGLPLSATTPSSSSSTSLSSSTSFLTAPFYSVATASPSPHPPTPNPSISINNGGHQTIFNPFPTRPTTATQQNQPQQGFMTVDPNATTSSSGPMATTRYYTTTAAGTMRAIDGILPATSISASTAPTTFMNPAQLGIGDYVPNVDFMMRAAGHTNNGIHHHQQQQQQQSQLHLHQQPRRVQYTMSSSDATAAQTLQYSMEPPAVGLHQYYTTANNNNNNNHSISPLSNGTVGGGGGGGGGQQQTQGGGQNGTSTTTNDNGYIVKVVPFNEW